MFQAFLPYLGAVLTTVIGLGMWQYQLITKRRYEVVEHALTIAGEAAQALHYIRQAEAMRVRERLYVELGGMRPDWNRWCMRRGVTTGEGVRQLIAAALGADAEDTRAEAKVQ